MQGMDGEILENLCVEVLEDHSRVLGYNYAENKSKVHGL